jgi:HSP20 family protein
MAILRFDPFRDPFRDMDRLTSQLLSGTRMPQAMPMDAWRSGDSYHIELDLPGADPESVDVTVERNALTVTAQRRQSHREGDEVIIAERPQGSFSRQLVLGEGLDTEAVVADYANGVLHLTIPVSRSAQPHKVPISGTSEQHRTIEATSSEPPPVKS